MTAAVVCAAGRDHTVKAFDFADQEAVSRDAETRGTGLARQGKCANGDNLATTWVLNKITQGALVCGHDQDQSYVFWTQSKDLAAFQLDGDATAGSSLYRFWLGFEPV